MDPSAWMERLQQGDREALGQFRDVKITGANKWSLFGELA